MQSQTSKQLQPSLIKVLYTTLLKFNPLTLFHNPVIFITEIGAILTTFEAIYLGENAYVYSVNISIWLWLTVLFANFSESIAEIRSKAHADTLKKTRSSLVARKLQEDGTVVEVLNHDLHKNDICLVKAGELVPADGQIIEGAAAIDESSFTGESQPVIRKAESDQDAVIAGCRVISDEIKIRVAADPGKGYLDKIVSMIEMSKRKKSRNETSLSILLSSLTLIFLIVIISLRLFGFYYDIQINLTQQVAFLICLIPTTIAGLLSAIGIAGITKLLSQNVLALSGQAVEASGDVDIILIDKTGTITYGNRMAYELIPSLGVSESEFHKACYLCSVHDETAEGKTIVNFLRKKFPSAIQPVPDDAIYVPFSAYTRLSGVDTKEGKIRKGAVDVIEAFVKEPIPEDLVYCIKRICERGGTPLLVASEKKILGVIYLKDTLKSGLSEKFGNFRKIGIKTVMVTGDNPITAKAIAGESDVDDFLASVSPEDKLHYLQDKQQEGLVLGMTGDGVNDAPALAQADLAVAMHAGTQAAKEAANMIDLDSNPTKLYEIIQIGKQMLMTRGALTTFSIANDVAKYFFILPAILSVRFPFLNAFNFLHLSTPDNIILSAVIFNALIIIALVPLAFKGVKLVPTKTARILNKNLLLYGVGGILFPFVAIKLIDSLVRAF